MVAGATIIIFEFAQKVIAYVVLQFFLSTNQMLTNNNNNNNNIKIITIRTLLTGYNTNSVSNL